MQAYAELEKYHRLAREYQMESTYLPVDYSDGFEYVMAIQQERKFKIDIRKVGTFAVLNTINQTKFLDSMSKNKLWDSYFPISSNKSQLAKDMLGCCNTLSDNILDMQIMHFIQRNEEFAN